LRFVSDAGYRKNYYRLRYSNVQPKLIRESRLPFQRIFENLEYAISQGGLIKPTSHGNFLKMQPIYARLRERARQIVAGFPQPDFYRDHHQAAAYSRHIPGNV